MTSQFAMPKSKIWESKMPLVTSMTTIIIKSFIKDNFHQCTIGNAVIYHSPQFSMTDLLENVSFSQKCTLPTQILTQCILEKKVSQRIQQLQKSGYENEDAATEVQEMIEGSPFKIKVNQSPSQICIFKFIHT